MLNKFVNTLQRPSDNSATAAVILLILGGFIAVMGYDFAHSSINLQSIVEDFYANAASEFISIAITVLIIDTLNQRRAKQQVQSQDTEAKEKKRLVFKMGSRFDHIAVEAARELVARGWTKSRDTTLQKASLWGANLQGVDLWGANLEGASLQDSNLQGAKLFSLHAPGANLDRANLQGASLGQANLQKAKLNSANLSHSHLAGAKLKHAWLQGSILTGANLWEANLKGAIISWANLQSAKLGRINLTYARMKKVNLQSANLWIANLENAYLEEADLRGAKMLGSNLLNAKLTNAIFDETTRLPDDDPYSGKRSFWTPETDMARFTDPQHADFWRSDAPYSPAYRGEVT